MSTPLENWVEESARLTKPSKIVWCDGSEQENERLAEEMLRDGTFIALNEQTYPALVICTEAIRTMWLVPRG